MRITKMFLWYSSLLGIWVGCTPLILNMIDLNMVADWRVLSWLLSAAFLLAVDSKSLRGGYEQ